jgi:hypothetical protein
MDDGATGPVWELAAAIRPMARAVPYTRTLMVLPFYRNAITLILRVPATLRLRSRVGIIRAGDIRYRNAGQLKVKAVGANQDIGGPKRDYLKVERVVA